MNFNHFGKPQMFHIGILKCSEVSHFCLTYNTLIVQINNTIFHIFIRSLPFLTFFCFSFHLFLGNLSLINNYINNICDLRSPLYKKLVHRDKNDNIILSLTHISYENLTQRKKMLRCFPSTPKKKKKTQLPLLVISK
jgi:hypothetical protein